MMRYVVGLGIVGFCLALVGCESPPPDKKPQLIGNWERDNGAPEKARIVWRMKFETGVTWQRETESAEMPETKVVKGKWTTLDVPKERQAEPSVTIKPDFILQLEYRLTKDDEIPVGAVVVERSADKESVVVRETWDAAIRADKDSGKDTLTLIRFDNPTPAAPINAQAEKYSRAE